MSNLERSHNPNADAYSEIKKSVLPMTRPSHLHPCRSSQRETPRQRPQSTAFLTLLRTTHYVSIEVSYAEDELTLTLLVGS